MRQLLNTECVVPDWLTDVVLGYGEPDSAHYSKLVLHAFASFMFSFALPVFYLRESFSHFHLINNLFLLSSSP